MFVVWKKLPGTNQIRCVLILHSGGGFKGRSWSEALLPLPYSGYKGTEEEARALDQLSPEQSLISLPSWSQEPLLGGEHLACQCFGVIISLFIFWENLWVQWPFFGIYFSHPTDGLLPPETTFPKRLSTTPGTLEIEYIKSGLWAAPHESYLIERVSE